MQDKTVSGQSGYRPKSDWKRSWKSKANKPFAQNSDIQRVRESQELYDFVETKKDLLSSLDGDWLKNPKIAQEIFGWLNGFTKRKNEKNNQYLIDFKTWLLKEIKGKRSKDQVRDDLKRIYSQFTVHGQKSKMWLLKKTDIDWSASLLLLELAWFKENDKENINFVSNGESWPGMNIDTSDSAVWWLKVELKKHEYINKKWEKKEYSSFFNSILSLDEHWWWPCSSTRMIYEILKDFNRIPHDQYKQVARFVQFVDVVDDLGYQVSGVVSQYLERTIFGLHRSLPIEFIFDYFKYPNRTGFEYLSDDYLSQTKIKNFDANWEFKWSKSLKKISLEKKDRMDRWMQEYLDLEKNWYFLTYKGHRFVVDLWSKITDWPETASICDGGIIRIFPSGDLYIYSPIKLPAKIGWFESINEHFIIDKIWSGKNLDKLLKEFEIMTTKAFFLEQKEENWKLLFDENKQAIKETSRTYNFDANELRGKTKEDLEKYLLDTDKNIYKDVYKNVYDISIDPWSKLDLKKEIVQYRQNIEKEELLKKNKVSKWSVSLDNKLEDLPDLKMKNIEVWERYKWIVNNKMWNMLFVTLDKMDQIRWKLHKNKSWEKFSSIKIWDEIYVIVEEKEDNKISFKLDGATK